MIFGFQRKLDIGAVTASPSSDELKELDRVALTVPVSSEAGTVPAGATGTIVGVWQAGHAFEVEIARPFAALVTVTASQVVRADHDLR